MKKERTNLFLYIIIAYIVLVLTIFLLEATIIKQNKRIKEIQTKITELENRKIEIKLVPQLPVQDGSKI